MNGSVRIPNDILLLPLSGAELKVYAVLSALNFASGGKYVKISHSAIASHTGVSVSSVRRAVAKMVKRNILGVCRTYSDGKRISDRYRVQAHKCTSKYISLDMNTVFKYSSDKLLTYAGLLMHANAHKTCYISERKLARKIGLSVPTLRKYTKELEREGVIQKHERFYKKTKQTKAHRSFAYVIGRGAEILKCALEVKKTPAVISRISSLVRRAFKKALRFLFSRVLKKEYFSTPPP